MQKHVQKLSDRMMDYVTSGSVLNLGVAYTALIGDVVTEYVLDASYNSLDMEDFNQGMAETLPGFGLIWRVTKHIPWIQFFFLVMPAWLMEKLSGPKMKAFTAFNEVHSKACSESIINCL